MALSTEQLETLIARALPDERLKEARALPGDRYALALAGGERLNLQAFGTPEAAETAAAALRLLRGEVDLPLAQLRASDTSGATVGRPYLLLSELGGEPLAQALPQLSDDQLYQLGRRLGEIMCRVHRLSCDQYGPLAGSQPAAGDERSYVLSRLLRDLEHCEERGLLDRRFGAQLTSWFEREFKPAGAQPALVHGALGLDTVLVRQFKSSWQISGLLGWERALGWSPAWDHVTWLDATSDPRYFGLRVGYGSAYDEHTSRTYEQIREHALAPYRMLLMLQLIRDAHDAGNIAQASRQRTVLRKFSAFLDA